MTVEADRWTREPDPNQAEHDKVDEHRRQEELRAQDNMTDATLDADIPGHRSSL